jgi:hypothetical protein
VSTRSASERVAAVRRLLAAARSVYERRADLATAIGACSGLSPQGVELGFGYLELDARDADLVALVEAVPESARVHVVLSANVFIAPLRALALAKAAAHSVTVRPSARDPWLARALVAAAGDPDLSIIDARDVGAIDADSIHVYGRDETIAAVRNSARAGAAIVAHGAGLGVAVLTAGADVEAAAARIALDVVAFDQRGCLSPRVVVVEGGAERGRAVGRALDQELGSWAARVPRGRLSEAEKGDARRWIDTASFAGSAWLGAGHAVSLGPRGGPLAVPPPGRHVHVAPVDSLEQAASLLAPLARFVAAVGSDDATRAARVAPAHARMSALGEMQRPPLDGPVDRRRHVPG